MARSPYPVYITTAPASSSRRYDREDRDRGRTRNRERDLVDYVHERDRQPRPPLKHRESSREGRRRHEYRYYSPHRSPVSDPRARSEERMSPAVVKEVAHSSTRRRGRRHEDDAVDEDIDRRPHRADRDRGRRASAYDADGRRGEDGRDGRRRDDGDGKDNASHSRRRQTAQHAGKTALAAGALEAVRQRSHGGGTGDTWKRVATAALGAAAIDAATTKVRHKDPRDKGKGSMLGASLGGLVVDSLVQRAAHR